VAEAAGVEAYLRLGQSAVLPLHHGPFRSLRNRANAPGRLSVSPGSCIFRKRKRTIPRMRLRPILFFVASALGSIAFQATVAIYPQRLQEFAWAVKWVWIGWAAIWVIWLVTHYGTLRGTPGHKPTDPIQESRQPINITVSPTISPTISPTQTTAPTIQPETKEYAEPSPKICLEPLEPAAKWVTIDEDVVWRLGKGDSEIAALILPFYLDPIQSDPVYSLEYVKAHLVFTNTSSGKKFRVPHGCWVNASLDSLEFRPGEIKYLILVIIQEYGSKLVALSTNRTKYDWSKTEGTEEFDSIPLPAENYRLEVVLIWGGGGQFKQTYSLTLDLATLTARAPLTG
jgi:hypothetical protein